MKQKAVIHFKIDILGSKQFAEDFMKKHDRLNYLINNAGLFGDPAWKKKKDKSYWLVTNEGWYKKRKQIHHFKE